MAEAQLVTTDMFDDFTGELTAQEVAFQQSVNDQLEGNFGYQRLLHSVTAAEIQAIVDSNLPTGVIAAPGAGKAIFIQSAAIETKCDVVGFADGPEFRFVYSNDDESIPALFGMGNGIMGVDVGKTSRVGGGLGFFSLGPGGIERQNVDNVGIDFFVSNLHWGSPITGVNVAAGTGFAVNDTGQVLDNAYGDIATYRITAVDGGGTPTALVITDPGDGYGSGGSYSLGPAGSQPGTGTGGTCVIDPFYLATPDMTVHFTILYMIVDLH